MLIGVICLIVGSRVSSGCVIVYTPVTIIRVRVMSTPRVVIMERVSLASGVVAKFSIASGVVWMGVYAMCVEIRKNSATMMMTRVMCCGHRDWSHMVRQIGSLSSWCTCGTSGTSCSSRTN